jgi:aspartokinase
MAKIKVHNILHSPEQALVTLKMAAEKAGFLPSIFYSLKEEEVSVPFLTQSIDRNGGLLTSLVVDPLTEDLVRAAFQEGLSLSPPEEGIATRGKVVLTTCYGPHLGEIPGIANQILSALAMDGVEVLAVSASINSCLLVTRQETFSKYLRSLNRILEIPKA